MMKRLIALLLAVLMVLSLSACGVPSDEKTETGELAINESTVTEDAIQEENVPEEGITKEELEALKGEKDITVLREAIKSIDDFVAYLRAMNFSREGDYSTAEQLLEFGDSNQPRAYCYLLTSVLDDDYSEVGIIHVFKEGVNHDFYSYVKIEDTYHALDTFFSESIRMNIRSANLDELAIMCLEKSQVNGPMDQYEITRVMGPLGKVEAPNGEMLTIRERLGEEVFDYCGTQIPVGLGLPKMTEAEIDQMIAGGDYASVAETITTLADAVCYVKRAGFVFPQGGMHRYGEIQYPDTGNLHYDSDPFFYTVSGLESLYLVEGQCSSTSTLFHYLLRDNYPEIGYLHLRYTDKDGHAMIYIKGNDGRYYLVNPVQYAVGNQPARDWVDFYTSEKGCADTLEGLMTSLAQSSNPGKWGVRTEHLYSFVYDGVYCIGIETEFDDPNLYMSFPEGADVICWRGNPDFIFRTPQHSTSQEHIIGLPKSVG